jgi:hypothetical protein
MIGCSLCGTESVVRVALSDGCQAWPDDREQELCGQHLMSICPIGDMEVVTIHRKDIYEMIEG